ncbi:MAG: hypothetical protein SWX82_15415 [Cyanobacteriota bacterium]|nr:hypothetical protein [Cyanobacteriota bacterium]
MTSCAQKYILYALLPTSYSLLTNVKLILHRYLYCRTALLHESSVLNIHSAVISLYLAILTIGQ